MNVLVATADGAFTVDLDSEELEPAEPFEPVPPLTLNLPRVIASAAAGSTVVAVVDASPPLLISHDAGTTWRDSGRGLPAGRAVAISSGDPDVVVFAARNRLYISRNGGVFWTALTPEVPEIEAIAIRE
jgi:hypothetical protein